jgi:hypothetical protein
MIKTLATTLMAVSGTVALAGEAQACGCCPCPQACAPAPACAAAPADPHAGMPMAQGTRTYQSFSYEPGAAPAPATTVRMTTRSSGRGDRFGAPYQYGDVKASGRYLWNAR